MNKKVSTLLTMGFVLGCSLLSASAFAQGGFTAFSSVTPEFAKENFDGKTKLYLSGDDATGNDVIEYTPGVSGAAGTVKFVTGAVSTKSLWTISTTSVGGTTYYTFKNATNGKVLMFDQNGVYTETAATTNLPTEYTVETNALKANTYTMYYDGSAQNVVKMATSQSSLTAITLGVKLPSATNIANTALNSLVSDHFSLTFPDVENLKENVFADELVALTVGAGVSGFNTSTNEMMFAVKSTVPSTITGAQITTLDQFKGIKFIALNPKAKAPIGGLKNADGEGYTFTTIYGRDLVSSAADTKDSKINKANAIFKVEEEAINHKGEYKVSLSAPYIYNEETEKQVELTGKTLVVNALQAGNDYYVTTQLSDSETPLKPFKAGTTSYVSAEDVLKVKAISVVNIYNMTEDDANYGEALSNASSNQWVAPKLLDLDAPEGQWIITSKDGKFTFSNRENGTKYEGVTLFKTGVDNVYTVQATSSVLNGKTIKLDYKAIEATDGFAVLSNDDLDMYTYNIGFTAPMYNSPFFITGEAENNAAAALDQDETKAASFSITKYSNSADENVLNVTDTIYSVQEYSFINDKKEVENKKDTLKVLAYTFNLTNEAGDKFYFASGNKFVAGKAEDMRENADDAKAYRFILKETATGYKAYALDKALSSSDKAINVVNTKVLGMTTSGTLALGTTATITDMVIEKVLPGTSLDMTNGHVKFAAQGGGYFALNEKNEGVMAQTVLKAAATEEDLTFYLDTVDADALVPSFYITKGVKAEAETKAAEATRLYMYRPAADSLSTFNKAEAKYELNEDYAISGDVDAKTGEVSNAVVKVLFREAARNGNTIELTQNGEKVTVAAKAEGDVLGGVNDFRFQIVQAGDEEGVYYIKSGKNYVSNKNNVLVYSNEKSAQAVVVEATEAPTSNESVSATEVKVVANNGSVVVKNAAGKNVVVSTILGQVVANEVLTSDNATINVPAGIVVVAVEGESFKVNVK